LKITGLHTVIKEEDTRIREIELKLIKIALAFRTIPSLIKNISMRKSLFTIGFSILAGLIQAQNVSKFSLPDAVSGKEVSLNDYNSKKTVVLIFTSNYCPYSKLYEDRIISLASQFASKSVQFILINSNDAGNNKEDTMEEMKKRAGEKGFSFPYLADKDQSVCKSFNATKTPEAFVLKNNSGNFTLIYSGAIDDNPQVEKDVTENYLRDAINTSLGTGSIDYNSKKVTGCMIKKS
jgi:peroxiredoxin